MQAPFADECSGQSQTLKAAPQGAEFNRESGRDCYEGSEWFRVGAQVAGGTCMAKGLLQR